PPQYYTLSLHDALPIFTRPQKHRGSLAQFVGVIPWHILTASFVGAGPPGGRAKRERGRRPKQLRAFQFSRRYSYACREIWCENIDRKSTRLNSSHLVIS